MFSTIWNLIPNSIKMKIGIGISILVLILGSGFWFQNNKINSLNNKLIACQEGRKHEKMIYDDEIKKALKVIEEQNKELIPFKLDAENYQKTIKEEEIALSKSQIKVQQDIAIELYKDNSESNQLKIINRLLKGFSDASN